MKQRLHVWQTYVSSAGIARFVVATILSILTAMQVRCDRTVGGCENCRRLGFVCSLSGNGDRGESASPSASSRTTLDRRRSRRACLQCREKKTKCSNQLPACHRCLQKKLHCTYVAGSRQSHSSSPGHLVSTGQDDLASSPEEERNETRIDPESSHHMSKVIVRQHIDAYFAFVAPIPCYGFIHRASFLHRWNQGRCNPRLLNTICGISARFMDTQQTIIASKEWMFEAEQGILRRLDSLVVSDVEALVLLALDHCMSRRFVKTLTSSCLAARMAYLMRLNHEIPRLPFLAREGRRRLIWAIFAFDTIYSSGRSELTSCSANTIHVQLPCHERAFEIDSAAITEPLRSIADVSMDRIGTTGFLVRILDVRDRIQR
jgi:hypothetical protein